MRKFIATLTAAALAIAGAVVVAPTAQANHPWTWNYSNIAQVDEYQDTTACGPKSGVISIPEANRPDENAWVAEQVHTTYAPAGCEDGRTVTLTLVEGGGCAGSYTICFRNYSSDPLGNTYQVKNDFGVDLIYMELVSGTFNFDECREAGREYAEEKYGPLMPWYQQSGISQPRVCSVGFELEPQVDEDCADDQLLVPTTTGTYGPHNKCVTAPVAVSGGKEDKDFNSLHYDGIVGDDWKLFEYCPSVDYIGNWMKLQNGKSWTDWYRENLALDNLSTDDALMDCEDRVIDAVDGDQRFLGLSSFTSFSHAEDFFTLTVSPSERLCDIAPLKRGNRHEQHCATTVRFSQVVTTWVDPNQYPPDPEWGVDPLPGEGPQVGIELPAVPDSIDYEFVYEQGEAGVCLYDGEEEFVQNGLTFCGTPVDNPVDVEPIQEWQPPPPECWQGPNNCPVGQSISYAVPKYMMVGVPVNVTVYATRTVEDELGRFNYGQPDNGTAVIHYGDHESDPPVAGVPFKNGQATFRIVPQEAGKKNFSICGVLNSGTSGGNAYIECIDGETTVLEYDPETYRKAFRDLALEKGDRFTLVDRDQAKGKVAKRLEWRVAQSDEDVCAVYETKKGKIRAKFNKTGECTVLWEDPKTGESGRLQIGS